MKNYLLIMAMILSGIGLINAQKVCGNWLITKVKVDGQEQGVYMPINFLENGDMEVSGRNMGTWSNEQKKKIILITSEKFKELNGSNDVKEINEQVLVIENSGARVQLMRLDKPKIAIDNQSSGLIGAWLVKDEKNPDVTKILMLKAPDVINYLEHSSSMETTCNGTWIYDAEKTSLIVMGRVPGLKGENEVVKKGDVHLELINEGRHFLASRKDQNSSDIERLTFTGADFYSPEGDYKYEEDEQKLPWHDPYILLTSLADVQHLVYEYSALIDETGVFDHKQLTAEVTVNKGDEVVNIDFIFCGYDQYNLPEDVALPPNQINVSQCANKFYPQLEMVFRVIGNEQLMTPAGTFDCTVIEGVDSFEVRKKCWMVNDRPGVYAKIIEDKPGDFGHYIIYELQEM